MTELQNIAAGILINKIDLLNDDALVDKHELLIRYKRLGYPVLYVSVREQHGFVELLAQLKNKTTVLVGLSGVGKSAIIKALLPDYEITVGDLSEQGVQGRHTTTTARLYHLKEGGNLIDSPGVREFALEGLQADEILQGFVELREVARECKFRDCQHQQQPGCAIQAAVKTGKIHPLRLAAYQRIISGQD
jgi:ribosome biogenesis GTPase